MGQPNNRSDVETNRKSGLALARDLKIMEHLKMFEDLRIYVDPARIGDEKHPSVEVVTGLIFRPSDKEAVVMPLSPKANGMKRVTKGHRGDLIVSFQIAAVVAWSRQNEDGETVPLDSEGAVEVIPADVLHTYGDDSKPLIPINKPINSVIAWEYNQYGDKVMGLFLPYDFARATAEGWWILGDVVADFTLYPGLSRRRKGQVEAKAIHPSGKVIVALHPVLDFTKQERYAFIERGGMIGLIPLPQVGKVDVEAAVDAAEIEIQGEKVEPGPDDFVVGNKLRNVWEQLKEFNVTSETPLKALRAVRKKIVTQKHPDQLQGRLTKAKTPAALIKTLVGSASVQLPLFTAAIDRTIELAEEREKIEAIKQGLPKADGTPNGESAPPAE